MRQAIFVKHVQFFPQEGKKIERERSNYLRAVLSDQKTLSGSGRAVRLRLMGKYIIHRLVAKPETDDTFWNRLENWK